MGYYRDIMAALQRRGAIVDFLADRPFDSPVMKAMTRLAAEQVGYFARALHRRQLEAFAAADYDAIFIINGQTLLSSFMQELRAIFPRAHTVLYMWDSSANRSSLSKLLTQFDHAATFDPDDSVKYAIDLRELFFAPERVGPNAGRDDYDLCFIGTAHTDRARVVDRLKHRAAGLRLYTYLYLQARWVYHVYKARGAIPAAMGVDDFRFRTLPAAAVGAIMAATKAVLDIEHPRQRGLTIRTIETIGSGKKLVTTNRTIERYPFYDRSNIHIIDRAAPDLDHAFIHSPASPLSAAMLRRLSVDGWIDDLLRGLIERATAGSQHKDKATARHRSDAVQPDHH